MDLKGRRANIHLHFSKITVSRRFPSYYSLKKDNQRNSLMDKSEAMMRQMLTPLTLHY
jgi:hypothetical protein